MAKRSPSNQRSRIAWLARAAEKAGPEVAPTNSTASILDSTPTVNWNVTTFDLGEWRGRYWTPREGFCRTLHGNGPPRLLAGRFEARRIAAN